MTEVYFFSKIFGVSYKTALILNCVAPVILMILIFLGYLAWGYFENKRHK